MTATLRSMRPLIASAMPEILDDLYAGLTRFQEAAGMFSDPAEIAHAKASQLKHWDAIAAAEFDRDYIASVTRIGRTCHALGLEPRRHISTYAVLIAGLVRAIEAVERGFGRAAAARETNRMVTAITTAALLDMDLIVSAWLEAGTDMAHNRMQAGSEGEHVMATLQAA